MENITQPDSVGRKEHEEMNNTTETTHTALENIKAAAKELIDKAEQLATAQAGELAASQTGEATALTEAAAYEPTEVEQSDSLLDDGLLFEGKGKTFMTAEDTCRFNKWWPIPMLELEHTLPEDLRRYQKAIGYCPPQPDRVMWAFFNYLERYCIMAAANLNDKPKMYRRIEGEWIFLPIEGDDFKKMEIMLNTHVQLMEYMANLTDAAINFIEDTACLEGKGYVEKYHDALYDLRERLETLQDSAYIAAFVLLENTEDDPRTRIMQCRFEEMLQKEEQEREEAAALAEKALSLLETTA